MDFEVVILGSDINAYYMARCCYEAYRKKAYLIGCVPMSFTSLSKILIIKHNEKLHDIKVLKKELKDFYEEHKSKKLLLIPSNDEYQRLIIENQDYLKKYYYFHIISEKLLNNLLIKNRFYSAYTDIDIPLTYIYDTKEKLNLSRIDEIGYPLILKPGNGVNYHHHTFVNQAKVYKIKNEEELLNVVNQIKQSGYIGKIIIQEFIPGDDSHLFDCVVYCNRFGKVKLMTFAQIALQEHTPTGLGNCTVLINGYNEFNHTEEITQKLKDFIETLDYHGFAEFDLKYDERSGQFKILEINPRQARSSYYLAALGYNLVQYLVDDLLFNKDFEYHFLDEKIVLSFVSKRIIRKYVENDKLKKAIFEVIKEKGICNPLNYKKDNSLRRKIRLLLRQINYERKYKKYKW